MPTKLSTANVYTDAELLALYREAVAIVSVSGQTYTTNINGHETTWTSADLDKLWETIDRLESRINSTVAPATNLARLVRP